MTGWLLRQLRLERGNTLFACIAIGTAVAVVLVLQGFESGLYQQLRQVVMMRGGDLIVTQRGVTSFLASRSTLRQLSRGEVEAVPGVAAAWPLTLVPLIYERHGRKTPIMLLVHDGRGGPGPLVQGRGIAGPREVVVDVSLLDLQHLSVGDTLELSGFGFRIVGATRGAAAMFTPLVFVRYDDLIDFYFESDLMGDLASLPLLGYLIVDAAPGVPARRLAQAIEAAVPDVSAWLPDRLAERDVTLGRTLFGPVMTVLVAIGYLICLLVVALILFSSVAGRQRSLGLMMALGFPARSLLRIPLLEALLLTLAALPVGLLAALAIAGLVEWSEPLYRVEVTGARLLAQVTAATLLIALLAALVPLCLLTGLEPMRVFRR